MSRLSTVWRCGALCAAFLAADASHAQQLTYQPLNPAFGGFSANYSWLLSSAQAQNDYTEDRTNAFNRDPLADFQSSLQRQILNQLSRELITNRFGDLDLTQPGTFNFGDLQVEIIPGIDGISVQIFNTLTGESTTVTIPNAP
jgi:curli production assembly/transport component CsgF